jgi:hypothetical protein
MGWPYVKEEVKEKKDDGRHQIVEDLLNYSWDIQKFVR